MHAEVRGFHSPDVDLAGFMPEDPTSFGFHLQVLVGPSGAEGEESFDLLVCSPRWFERERLRDGPAWGVHTLLVQEYDWPRIRAFLTRHFARVSGATWSEVANKLNRFARWEFDGYQDSL